MKSHTFDAISFISGLVITLLGLVFLVPQTPVDLVDAVTSFGSWFWPVLLLVIGIAIMVPAFAKRHEDEVAGDVAPVSSPVSEDDLP